MKSLLLALAAAAVLLVGWFVYSSMAGGVIVETAAVETGPIQEFVDEQGKTRLPRVHVVAMPFSGLLKEVRVAEGDEVSLGQDVALVSPQDLKLEADIAQQAVDRLAASIKESEDVSIETTGLLQAAEYVKSMDLTVQAADERVKSGEARARYAQTRLQRGIELAEDGRRISPEELDQLRLLAIEADVDYTQDKLVAAALKAIQIATDLLPKTIQQYITRKGLTVGVLEEEREQADARLEQMKLQQSRGEMKSPIAGVVLEVRDDLRGLNGHDLGGTGSLPARDTEDDALADKPPVAHESGKDSSSSQFSLASIHSERFLPAGTELVKIGRLEELEVEADILSQDVVRVEQGQAVEVYGPAIGPRPVRGTVKQIFPAGFTKISSLGVEQQRVKVVVELPPQIIATLREKQQLGLGYRVRVKIFTAEKQDAKVIPRSALFRGAGGDWQVFAVESGKARLRDVEVGLMNDERVEITSGLDSGDQVILAPETSLTDGARVKAAGE